MTHVWTVSQPELDHPIHNRRESLDLSNKVRSKNYYLLEVVLERPACIGASDAAHHGMGSMLFDHKDTPYIWRAPFSGEMQCALVTFENPKGTITNSVGPCIRKVRMNNRQTKLK